MPSALGDLLHGLKKQAVLSRAEAGQVSAASSLGQDRFAGITTQGGELAGDEWASQIVRGRNGVTLRPGTILKRDMWHESGDQESNGIRGAINFRRVSGSNLFALSQPTDTGVHGVVSEVLSVLPGEALWLNLR